MTASVILQSVQTWSVTSSPQVSVIRSRRWRPQPLQQVDRCLRAAQPSAIRYSEKAGLLRPALRCKVAEIDEQMTELAKERDMLQSFYDSACKASETCVRVTGQK